MCIRDSHGAYKFKPGQKPQLRFDILHEVEKQLPNYPIVLHGASSVIPEYVEMINQNGGNMPDAIGIPEEMLREAAKSAVCKINICLLYTSCCLISFPSSNNRGKRTSTRKF